MDWIPMLGTAAGVVSTLSFLPQVFKIWRTQSTKDISLGMYSLYSLGLVLWGFYALMIKSWPLLMTEIITGVMTGYILMIKVKGLKH
jgi:MtN3 and saliva related transmembrane protein